MAHDPLLVVMITNEATAAVEAAALGAVDFVIKQPLVEGVDLEEHLHFYERLAVAVHASLNKRAQPVVLPAPLPIVHNIMDKELVIIGSSTGGPAALQMILTQIPPTIGVPVLVVQHMPPRFTRHLASHFNTLCAVKVKETEHNGGNCLHCAIRYSDNASKKCRRPICDLSKNECNECKLFILISM